MPLYFDLSNEIVKSYLVSIFVLLLVDNLLYSNLDIK